MSEPTNTEEIRIKALLEAWADAVRRHDVPAILAHHEADMVMFDLPPPLQCQGIKAYEQTWDLLFRYHKPGTAFDFQELSVTAGQDVAFAVAIMRCGPDSSSKPSGQGRFPVPADRGSSQSRKRLAHRARASLRTGDRLAVVAQVSAWAR
jgi:ketosteroid isomerase-like protein